MSERVRRGSRGARWWAAAVIGLAALAACATPVPGRAVAVDTAALPAAPGEPAAGLTPPPQDFTGRLLESIRLARATPVVPEVFPDHFARSCTPIGDLASPDIVERTSFPEGTVTPILKRYGYVAGWRSCGARVGSLVVTVALSLEMADPAAARAAATDLAATSLLSDEEQTTVLNGASAQISAFQDQRRVQIWMPVGRVLAFVVHDGPSETALGETIRLAGAHARLLSSFRPTPQAEVSALPVDPLGLGRLTAPVPGGPAIGAGPYDLAATLHTLPDPVADRALFTANGYTGSYRHSTSENDVGYHVVLDAFAGPAQAETVRARLVAAEAAQSGRGPFTVPAVPDATCYVSDLTLEGASRYTQRCFVTRRGFLAHLVVDGVDAPDDTAAMSGLLAAQVDLIDG